MQITYEYCFFLLVLTLDFLGGSSAFAVVDENQEQVEVCLFIVSGIIQDMVVVSLMVDVGEGTATGNLLTYNLVLSYLIPWLEKEAMF